MTTFMNESFESAKQFIQQHWFIQLIQFDFF